MREAKDEAMGTEETGHSGEESKGKMAPGTGGKCAGKTGGEQGSTATCPKKIRRRRLVHPRDLEFTFDFSDDREDHKRTYQGLARAFLAWRERVRKGGAGNAK